MAANPAEENRGNHVVTVIGRLKPGMNIARASSELNSVTESLEREHPTRKRGASSHGESQSRGGTQSATQSARRVRAPRLLVHAFAKKHRSLWSRLCYADRAVTKGSGVFRLRAPYGQVTVIVEV